MSFFENRFGKGNRRPERFRPHPEGQVPDPLFFRHRNAPFHVPGQPERHQGFARAEPDALLPQHGAGLFAVLQRGKYQSGRGFAGIDIERVRRHPGTEIFNALHILVFDIDHRIFQEFLDDANEALPAVFLLPEIVLPGLQLFGEPLQIEVPVPDGFQGRRFAGGDADRMNQLVRAVLVAEGTFVGVRRLRIAAHDGAASCHLAAVQVFARLFVIKLLHLVKTQVSRLIQTVEDIRRQLAVDVPGPP